MGVRETCLFPFPRRALSASYPALTFIDCYDAMQDGANRPLPALFAKDGLHLSREGYAVWVREFLLTFSTPGGIGWVCRNPPPGSTPKGLAWRLGRLAVFLAQFFLTADDRQKWIPWTPLPPRGWGLPLG